MFCSKCGKEIQDDAVLCAYCGTKVLREKPNKASSTKKSTSSTSSKRKVTASKSSSKTTNSDSINDKAPSRAKKSANSGKAKSSTKDVNKQSERKSETQNKEVNEIPNTVQNHDEAVTNAPTTDKHLCVQCGKEIKKDAKWCLFCGAQQNSNADSNSNEAASKTNETNNTNNDGHVVVQNKDIVQTPKKQIIKKNYSEAVKKHKVKLIAGGIAVVVIAVIIGLVCFLPYYNNTLVPKGHYDSGLKILNNIEAKEKSGDYTKSTETYFNLSEDFVPMIRDAANEFDSAGNYEDAPLYACSLNMIKILYSDKKDPYYEWSAFIDKYQDLVNECKDDDGNYLTDAGRLYGFAMGGMQYYAAYDYYLDKDKDKAKKYLGYSYNWYEALPDDYSFAGMTKKEKIDKCLALARTFDDMGWVN